MASNCHEHRCGHMRGTDGSLESKGGAGDGKSRSGIHGSVEGSGEDGGQGALVSSRERPRRWRHKGGTRPGAQAWGQDTVERLALRREALQGGTSAGGMGRRNDALKMWVGLSQWERRRDPG